MVRTELEITERLKRLQKQLVKAGAEWKESGFDEYEGAWVHSLRDQTKTLGWVLGEEDTGPWTSPIAPSARGLSGK